MSKPIREIIKREEFTRRGDWLSSLRGRVPDGVLKRTTEKGGPPEKGPGRYSVCRALLALCHPEKPTRDSEFPSRPKRTKRRWF